VKTNVRFTNFKYDENKYYFLFISELKAYGIGHFFKEALSKILNIEAGDIRFITIAPDSFEQYNYDDLVIINDNKDRESKRKKHDDFIKDVSDSVYIDKILDRLLKNQKEVFVYMFETSSYMKLDDKKGVVLVGPNKNIVSKLSNKIELYTIFSKIVPMADFYIAKGVEDLLNRSKKMLQTDRSIFVSLEKSAAGANSIIAKDLYSIRSKFHSNIDDTFLITTFIPHKTDPTSLGVVINKDEVYVAGIADQRIHGTKFRGSTFPSKTSRGVQEEIISQTREVGKLMGKMGYRGIFGCDFIVTKDEKVYFIETNPRKQGTTMEFCTTLKYLLPQGYANLPELEFYAVTKSQEAPKTKEIDFFNVDLFWSTYNYKIDSPLVTNSYIPQQTDEIAMFERVAKNRVKKEFMIVEHIGQDFFVNEGSFLGRVISVGKNYDDVEVGIQIGKKLLAYTVKEYTDDNFTLSENCYRCKFYLNNIS